MDGEVLTNPILFHRLVVMPRHGDKTGLVNNRRYFGRGAPWFINPGIGNVGSGGFPRKLWLKPLFYVARYETCLDRPVAIYVTWKQVPSYVLCLFVSSYFVWEVFPSVTHTSTIHRSICRPNARTLISLLEPHATVVKLRSPVMVLDQRHPLLER